MNTIYYPYLKVFLLLVFVSFLAFCNNVTTGEIESNETDTDNELLNSFYTTYGGISSFTPNQILAIESLILAQEEIEAGQMKSANKRIESVFTTLPTSSSDWIDISSNSHCQGCPINVGLPSAYYGLRMLDQITELGLPENSETLTMTAVVAPCAEVTRPTLPNLNPETVNLNIAPEILDNDAERLKMATSLFRIWVQSITAGSKTNLVVHTLDECTTVDYSDDGSTIFTYPASQSMIDAVPSEIADETDFWWVIAPSGVPGDGSGYNRHFISGGMGGFGTVLPVFISDDAWFTRKPEHLGKGEYHEIEVMAYHPQWFQHEFMHHVYRVWNEFGLEDEGHQWFNRSTWPSDFVGSWEPDYYAESITKRLLDATPSLAAGLQAVEQINFELTDPAVLVGSFERRPIQNGWHDVEIILENESLIWQNAASVSWSLEIIDGELWTGSDCPYGVQRLTINADMNGELSSILFLGEPYEKVN